jgi:hypothetical protein
MGAIAGVRERGVEGSGTRSRKRWESHVANAIDAEGTIVDRATNGRVKQAVEIVIASNRGG